MSLLSILSEQCHPLSSSVYVVNITEIGKCFWAAETVVMCCCWLHTETSGVLSDHVKYSRVLKTRVNHSPLSTRYGQTLLASLEELEWQVDTYSIAQVTLGTLGGNWATANNLGLWRFCANAFEIFVHSGAASHNDNFSPNEFWIQKFYNPPESSANVVNVSINMETHKTLIKRAGFTRKRGTRPKCKAS